MSRTTTRWLPDDRDVPAGKTNGSLGPSVIVTPLKSKVVASAPALMFVLIYNTIQNMQVFTEIFIMTGGGPGHATTTIGYRIFQNAFIFSDFGMAGANAVVLLLIILGITAVQLMLTARSEKAYSDGGKK